MARQEPRRGGKKSEKARIDLSTLLPEQKKAGRKPEGDKIYTHTWTRAQGEGAGKKGEFRVVGIAPKKKECKARIKQNGKWKISKALEKWEEIDPSIVFVPSVYLSTFTKYFPRYYSDKEEILENEDPSHPEFIDLWIAGPRQAVIENLQQEYVLPDEDRFADSNEVDNWLSDVAITRDNYDGTMQDIYEQLLEREKETVKEKKKELADPQRIHEKIELAKAIKGKKVDVDVLDSNDLPVGKFGKSLTKPIKNVFTDALVREIKKGKIKEGVVPNSYIDISKLIPGDPNASVSALHTINESVNPSKGEYGATSKRSLGLNLTFTYDGKEYPLGDHFVWTTKSPSVDVLFAEMEAVNNKTNKTGSHYNYGGQKSKAIKASVNELLREYQDGKKEKAPKAGVRKGVDKLNK
jgi:hypothetical protein